MSREREQNIRSCFNAPVEFFYPQNVAEFNVIIENFQRKKKENDKDYILGENNTFGRLTGMDDISGLAAKSNDLGSFLIVVQKFNFAFVYVFHTMYPSKLHWKMIIS